MILGIDPGYARIGYAFLRDNGVDATPELADVGVISTSPRDDYLSRLLEIEKNLTDLISSYKLSPSPDPDITPNLTPDLMKGPNTLKAAGVEKVFFKTNAKTAIDVAQARGVILVTLKKHGLDVSEFSPLQIKKSITLRGNATKSEVEWMVMKILGLKKKISQDDAADAVAIALTCWYQMNHLKKESPYHV